ncbi:hypothetical protein ACRAWD_20350 [Caulobacter segnis]
MEVLRGPQGTLYGRNTTGGAIKLHHQPPDPLAERRPHRRVRQQRGVQGRRLRLRSDRRQSERSSWPSSLTRAAPGRRTARPARSSATRTPHRCAASWPGPRPTEPMSCSASTPARTSPSRPGSICSIR